MGKLRNVENIMPLCLNSWAVLINHLSSLVKSEPYSVRSLWTVCPDYFCPWAHLCVFRKLHSIHGKILQDPFILPFNFIQVNISPSIIWPFLIPFVRKRKKILKALALAGNSTQNAWLCAEIAFEIHFIKHESLFIVMIHSCIMHRPLNGLSCTSSLAGLRTVTLTF